MYSVIEVLGLAFSALSVTRIQCVKTVSLVLVKFNEKMLNRHVSDNMKSLYPHIVWEVGREVFWLVFILTYY